MTDELYLTHRSRLRDLLRRNALIHREVTLPSGKKSLYLNCKRTVLSAEGHFLVGWTFLHLLDLEAPDVSAVGGMALGACPLVSAVATTSYFSGSRLNAFIIRKEAKEPRQYIEGPENMSGGVAILEDVVNSGSTTLIAIKRARDFGLAVRFVLALVDREHGGMETIQKEVPAVAMFKFSDLM
jgi:orotate phosphoribosyltransferase